MLPSRSVALAAALAFVFGFSASWAYRQPPRMTRHTPGTVHPGSHVHISQPRPYPAGGHKNVRLTVKRAVRFENGFYIQDPPLPPGSELPCDHDDWIINVAGNQYLAGPAD
jgi:hypothetical protein